MATTDSAPRLYTLICVVGMVSALGVGFVLGREQRSAPAEPKAVLPANYDPARAVFADALKLEHESSETCWKQVVTLLGERAQTFVRDDGKTCRRFYRDDGTTHTICGDLDLKAKK